MPMQGIGLGLLVRSNEGRPTKIEGNPLHPTSLGGTDVFSQASVLGLYDPDRSRTATYLGEIRSWSGYVTEFKGQIAAQDAKRGAGLRILTENVTSPSLANQILQILAKYPGAKWHQYEPAFKSGAVAAGGGHAVYHFDKAERILSLDADFLGCGAEGVRHSRDFSKTRKVEETGDKMSRLYAVECTPTNTGAAADHRLPAKPSEIDTIARAIAQGLGVANANAGNLKPEQAKFVNAVVADLKEHGGRSIVVAGDYQPWPIHAMANAMNQALGNVGATVTMTAPLYAYPVDNNASLADLVRDLNAGTVDTLLIMGSNPVYSAPADLNFRDAIKKAKWRAHHGLYRDETSEYCQWHIPATHYLEQWGDIKAHDGTVSIIQPLIAPLYNNKSEYEFLAAFAENPNETGYNIVRGFWQSKLSGNFEQAWKKAVHDGVLAGAPAVGGSTAAATPALPAPQAAVEGLELVFRPDPTIHDGRFANNGWLQELPKPLTKLTWDNAVMISPTTAKRLGLGNRMGAKGGDYNADIIEITYQDRKLTAPIWIMPGQPDDVLTLHMGYGRHRAGRVAEGAGFNANLIRTVNSPFWGSGVQVRATGESVALAVTQTHSNMEGRDIVRSASLADYIKNKHVHSEGTHSFAKEISLYPEYDYSKGFKWGMAIDLNSCTGCSACVVACVSENNIPVVGREQVQRSREMHWLRIDRYYSGEIENPETVFQPLLCQQCEKAPCEVVCPVGATVHSAEGLNDMVYNRCIGTRYCSHNCPYKVRRFNFLLFQDFTTPEAKMVRNPEVTIRSRGVMEKCTYCVQRIQNGKFEAEKENRRVKDGEIQTACQSACPADAIIFGDLNDAESKVSKLKTDPRNYALLAELNTQPRTTYLAALKNVNPALAAAPATADAHGH
jgi:molybdopterin-containing oxidoreductase family iron-sulfur binding subunit